MTLGFGLLRLAPRDFWSMTPREIAAAMPRTASSAVPGRTELASLMADFPDRGDRST